uniref:Uncharacterized protein n=1 Tax=Arundo donax TaxID=35708 RepID=A0A0A9FGP4_ARUDO
MLQRQHIILTKNSMTSTARVIATVWNLTFHKIEGTYSGRFRIGTHVIPHLGM